MTIAQTRLNSSQQYTSEAKRQLAISVLATAVASMAFGGLAIFAIIPAHLGSTLGHAPARFWQRLRASVWTLIGR